MSGLGTGSFPTQMSGLGTGSFPTQMSGLGTGSFPTRLSGLGTGSFSDRDVIFGDRSGSCYRNLQILTKIFAN